MSKKFPTVAVVSAVTGIFLGGDFGDVHAVLDYALDDQLFTHQLPAAFDAAKPGLLAQHPWIGALDLGGVHDEPTATACARLLVSEHGETLTIEPVTNQDWKRYNALADLVKFGKPVVQ